MTFFFKLISGTIQTNSPRNFLPFSVCQDVFKQITPGNYWFFWKAVNLCPACEYSISSRRSLPTVKHRHVQIHIFPLWSNSHDLSDEDIKRKFSFEDENANRKLMALFLSLEFWRYKICRRASVFQESRFRNPCFPLKTDLTSSPLSPLTISYILKLVWF